MLSFLAVFIVASFAMGPPSNGLTCENPDFLFSQAPDLTKYVGTWYEMANSELIRETFQRNCLCTQVRYTLTKDELDNDYIVVENVCRAFSPAGPLIYIKGRADVLNASFPGEIAVQFFSPLPATTANYYTIRLGEEENYGTVLVGSPCRDQLWILNRERTIDATQYESYKQTGEDNGFDTEAIKFQPTVQICPDIYPRTEVYGFRLDQFETLTSISGILGFNAAAENNWILEMVDDVNGNGYADDGDSFKLNIQGEYLSCSFDLCKFEGLATLDATTVLTMRTELEAEDGNPIGYLQFGPSKFLSFVHDKFVLTKKKRGAIFKIVSPDRPVPQPAFPF